MCGDFCTRSCANNKERTRRDHGVLHDTKRKVMAARFRRRRCHSYQENTAHSTWRQKRTLTNIHFLDKNSQFESTVANQVVETVPNESFGSIRGCPLFGFEGLLEVAFRFQVSLEVARYRQLGRGTPRWIFSILLFCWSF